MNLKKKIVSAKDKIKPYAPQIVLVGAAVSALAYGIYSTAKTVTEAEELDTGIRLITGDDREKIVGDPDFHLYYVEDDYYFLTPDYNAK